MISPTSSGRGILVMIIFIRCLSCFFMGAETSSKILLKFTITLAKIWRCASDDYMILPKFIMAATDLLIFTGCKS